MDPIPQPPKPPTPTPATPPPTTSPSPAPVVEMNALGIPRNLPALKPQVAEPSKDAPADKPADKPTETSVPSSDDILGALTNTLGDVLKDTKPAEVTPAPSKEAVPPGKRDLSGLSAEEAPLFQQMSNEAYKRLYPAYLESKALKEQLSTKEKEFEEKLSKAEQKRFYDHEDAWRIDPQVQQLASQVQEIETLENHFMMQLKAIKSQQPWNDVERDASGKLVQSEDKPATVENEVAVVQHLNRLAAQKQMLGAQCSQRIESFKNEFVTVATKVSDFEKKVLGPFEKMIAPEREKALALFPEAVRGKPEYKLIAGLIVALNKAVNTPRGGNTPNDPNAGARLTGSPTEAGMTGGVSSGNTQANLQANLERINRIMRGE